MSHINQSNSSEQNLLGEPLKNLTNRLTPFKSHFGRLIKMVAPMAKIKQVFKVEKLTHNRRKPSKAFYT